MTSAGPPATALTSHETPSQTQLKDPLQEQLDVQLTPLLTAIERLASERADDPESLLDLLRRLEGLHRSIQDGAFRTSLPADRHCLFDLLQNMERSGGWPYIPRLQLRTFMDLLEKVPAEDASPVV
jgi:hypothetical protein